MATQTETVRAEAGPSISIRFSVSDKTDDAVPKPISLVADRLQLEPIGVSSLHETATDEPNYPTGAKLWLICLSVSLVLISGGLESNVVATALPAITDHFHTIADVGWYSAAYKLCACAFQFAFGKAYKLFSTKKIFLGSTMTFLIGSMLCAAAATSRMFVVGRAVAGLGTSGVIAGCYAIVIQTIPLRRRPVYISFFQAMESITVISAPILGGIITQEIGWRWCFWIVMPVGGVTLIAIVFCLTDPEVSPGQNMSWKQILRELDIVGNLVFVPSLTCLFLALSWAGTKYSWGEARVISMLVLFVLLFGIFVLDQHLKGDSATIPLRIVRNRNVMAGFVFTFCTGAALTISEYYYPTYLQVVKGKSTAESGYMLLPIIVGFIIAALMHGGGTTLLGYYTPFMMVTSILLPIGAGLMTTLSVDTKLAELIVYPGLAGFAAGIGFQAPQTAVQTTLPSADVQLGLAVILFAQFFGSAVMVSIAQTIFTSRLSSNLHHLAPNLDVESIENMGLTDLRTSFGNENLEKVVLGFSESLSQTWYLTVGLACFTLVGSLTMEWKSIKQKRS